MEEGFSASLASSSPIASINAACVNSPYMPSISSPSAVWNALTASSVSEPNLPSAPYRERSYPSVGGLPARLLHRCQTHHFQQSIAQSGLGSGCAGEFGAHIIGNKRKLIPVFPCSIDDLSFYTTIIKPAPFNSITVPNVVANVPIRVQSQTNHIGQSVDSAP